MTTAAKYDVRGAASVFAEAHHKRMRDAYAREQAAAARELCVAVLEAAASRGFSITQEDESPLTWHISAPSSGGDAYMCVSEQGDIQVSTRKLESPRPLKIRYDVVEKTFVSTDDTERCVATILAAAIVAALDEGWRRVRAQRALTAANS